VTQSHSLVTVYRANDKKLLRIEDSEARTIARMEQGKLKVTSFGMQQGYYVSSSSGRLMHMGETVGFV